MADPELVKDVTNISADNVASVAFTSLLVYDIIITMGEEIQFMWRGRWTFGKILYMLNRYVPPIDLTILMNSYMNPGLKHNFCLPWFKVDNCLLILSLCVIDMILLLRTWAVWQKKRWVLWTLIIVYVISMVGAAGSITYTTVAVISEPFPTQIRPCSSDVPITKVLYGLYVSVMLFDTTILSFTVARAVPQIRLYGLSPLWKALYQDGFFYYGVIFMASVANLIVLAAAPPELALLMITFHRAMFSAMGSRMVLNLHGVVMRPADFMEHGAGVTEMSTFKASKHNGEPVLTDVVVGHTTWSHDYVNMEDEGRLGSKSPGLAI